MNDITRTDLAIAINLPLDAEISGSVYYDSEGEPHESPTTVLDVVLDRAARMVATDVLGKISSNGYSYDSGVTKLYRSLVEPKVDAILAERVEAALAAMLRPKTEWGQPEAEPTPLAEWIAAKVDAYLTTGKGDSFGRKSSPLDSAIESIIGRDVQRALDDTMKDARARALAAFSKVAEEKLTEALRASLAQVAVR